MRAPHLSLLVGSLAFGVLVSSVGAAPPGLTDCSLIGDAGGAAFNLLVGDYTVTAAALGYQIASAAVRLDENRTIILALTIASTPIPAPN